jgi:hypothetical protein
MATAARAAALVGGAAGAATAARAAAAELGGAVERAQHIDQVAKGKGAIAAALEGVEHTLDPSRCLIAALKIGGGDERRRNSTKG